jgi:hypothetical protein
MKEQLIKKDKNIFYIVFDKLDKNKNKKDDMYNNFISSYSNFINNR